MVLVFAVGEGVSVTSGVWGWWCCDCVQNGGGVQRSWLLWYLADFDAVVFMTLSRGFWEGNAEMFLVLSVSCPWC